jgi:hypothetical protein
MYGNYRLQPKKSLPTDNTPLTLSCHLRYQIFLDFAFRLIHLWSCLYPYLHSDMSDNNPGGNSNNPSGSPSNHQNKDGPSPAANRLQSGLTSASSFNRRGSLGMTEAAFGDLFGRRSSGFSELDVLGRRGSLDSTSAVLDAAIMDLTRRRLSMAMGAGMGDDPFGGGSFGGGYGAAAAMGMDTMGAGAGAFGMSSLPVGPSSLGPPAASSSSAFPPAPAPAGDNISSSANNNTNSSSSEVGSQQQQQQIQEQQRELERRQKELETQRQQLMSAMEERRLAMQQMQQKLGQMPGATGGAMAMPPRNSLLGTFGGGLGGNFGGTSFGGANFGGANFGGANFGGANSNLLMAGLGGPRAFPGAGGGPPMGAPAVGASPDLAVCRICNARAFASREEAVQHEAICMAMGRRNSLGLGGGGGGRRSSLDLLVGTLDRPEFAARLAGHSLAGQSFRQDMNSRRDSLGMGIMSDRRFSLLAMGGMGGMADMPIHAPSGSGVGGPQPTPRTGVNTGANTVSSGLFAMMEQPLSLAMESDKEWLTPLHCFVRQHCVHVFTATEQDVQTPSKGKRKPIQVGQVGIRCPHCHHEIESSIKARERGSVYYPTSISSIYNATMNLLQRHLHNCSSVPPDIMRRYETLKADDARSGTSKKYWIESALSLGLVDTDNGIRFSGKTPPPLPTISRQQQSTANELAFSNNMVNGLANGGDVMLPNMTASGGATNTANGKIASSNAAAAAAAAGFEGNTAGSDPSGMGPLVRPEDERWATAFSFHLLCQMKPCVFTEADRLGKRKGLPPGFPGLACRHCFGGYGSGRFFPSSIKTLSDTSKTLNVLHNHMMRCRRCPPEIREILSAHRKTHDEQRAKMKFGSQKAFFARIWDRLHYQDPNVTAKRKFKAKGEPVNPALLSQQQVNGAFDAATAMSMQQQYGDMMNKRQKIS